MSEPIRPSLPRPDASADAASVESTADASADLPEVNPADVPPAYREAVKALTEQVAAAAETIDRLAAENERLQRRVRELEQRPEVPDGHTAVPLEEDREALRRRINGFIASIDAYLSEGDGDPADADASEPVGNAPAEEERISDEASDAPTDEPEGADAATGSDRPARAGDAPDRSDTSEAARPNSVTWDVRG